jgi:hypothetical protein
MRYAETAVAKLLFTCPNTNRKAPTGVEMDVQGLRAQWKARLKLDCPYCSDVHDICVREVYVNISTDRVELRYEPCYGVFSWFDSAFHGHGCHPRA